MHQNELIPEKCKYACIDLVGKVYVNRLEELYKGRYGCISTPVFLREYEFNNPNEFYLYLEQHGLKLSEPKYMKVSRYLQIMESEKIIEGLRAYFDTVKLLQKDLSLKQNLKPKDYEKMVSIAIIKPATNEVRRGFLNNRIHGHLENLDAILSSEEIDYKEGL